MFYIITLSKVLIGGHMKTFIFLLLSLVCIAHSQVPGPSGQPIEIFFEPVDSPKHNSKSSDFLFFLSFPTDKGYRYDALIIWQLHRFNAQMSLEALPDYYIQNPITGSYYKLNIQINSREIPVEEFPELIEYLQQSFINNPNFELKQDQEQNLKIIPLPTQ